MALDDEIASFPERKMDFIRWICVKIALANLPFISKPDKSSYTPESCKLIEQFIEYAVERWNRSHSRQLDIDETIEIIQQWWQDDIDLFHNELKRIER